MSQHNVQVLGDLELAGSLQFGKNLSDFPAVGKPREMVVKGGVPYMYTELVDGSGFFSWQPIGIKQASYLHTQGVASTVWTVTHNFNSTDFAYFVYDQNHHLVLANITIVDENTAQINLTQAMTGTAVFFSLQYLNSTTVAASSQLNLGQASLTTSAGVLKVNGNDVAFKDYVDTQDSALSARIDNLASNIDPAAIDSLSEVVTAFQNTDGDLTAAIGALSTSAASALATEVSRAQSAETALSGQYDSLSYVVNDKADTTDLVSEIDDRAAADTALQANIDAEATARAAADSALQTSINTKANASHTHSIANVVVDGSIIPDTDVAYDLGSDTKRFKDLFLSGNSIHIGGAVLSANLDGSIALPAGSKVGDTHIPTAVSGLTNDLGFQTASQVSAAIASAAPSLTGSTAVDFSAKNLTVAGNIMPAVSGVSTIGSATDKFAAIYTKEMHIDANTLYVDGVPVLGSSANTIQFTADTNQGMRISTTGSGVLTLESQSTTTLKSNGQNADVLVQSSGQGSMSRITSDTQVVLTAPTVNVQGNQSVSGDLVVTGNLTTHGSLVTVDSTNLAIKDNVITVNKGETGSGVSVRYAGIDVDRGDLARERVVWDETAGKWKMGATGQEAAIASEDYVTTAISGKANTSSLATVATSGSYADLSNKPTIPTVPTLVSAFTNDAGYQTSAQVSTAITSGVANKVDKVSGKGLSTEDYTTAEKSKLGGIEAGAQVNTVTSVAGKTGIVSLAKADVGLGSVDNTSDLSKPVSTATQTALNLKANSASLATVATTGAYADLTGKPTIPTVPTAVSAFTNDSNYQTATQVTSAIAAVVGAAPAALDTLKEIADQLASDESAVSALTTTVSGKADKATTLAGYGIADAYTKTAVDTALALKANSSALATVATSGSYTDLTNKPTIPTVPTLVSAFTNDAGYQTAANVTTAIANKADKATTLSGYGITDAYTKTAVDSALSAKASSASLATVATSGSYTDLTNKPTIPTVPTIVSAFTNDSGYQTAANVTTAIANKADKATTLAGYGITDAQAKHANLTTVAGLSTASTGLVKFTNGVASLDSSSYQTAAQVTASIQAVVGAAPAALDTLQEIAAQLATDESAVSALTTTVSGKVTANAAITAGSAVKVNYDTKGLVTGVGTLTKADLASVLSGLTWTDFA